MKKLFFLAIAILMIAITGTAQTVESYKAEMKLLNKRENFIAQRKRHIREELRKLEGSMVSNKTKKQFGSDFGDIAGTGWTRGEYYDEASFLKDGQRQTAFYDYDSKLVGTVTEKAFTDLPASAQDYINKKYSDYSKVAVIFYDDNELNPGGITMYGETVDKDNYFVELRKDNRRIMLKITTDGDVSFFSQLF